MKNSIWAVLVPMFALIALPFASFGQTMPEHCISFLGGMNLNGGYEAGIETEYYFNNRHNTSLYGIADYHYAKENILNYGVDAKKMMFELGWKKYFAVIPQTFYPYIGLGVTGGMQQCTQTSGTPVNIADITDNYLLGAVGTIGLEYMYTPSISIVASCRFKYDDNIHYVIGAGLKFGF